MDCCTITEKEDSDHEEDTLEKKETNVKQKGKASAAFFSDAMALVTRFHSCPYCFKILTSYKERKSHMILHKDKQVSDYQLLLKYWKYLLCMYFSLC